MANVLIANSRIDPQCFVFIDPKIVARIEHIEAMLEASEKEKRAEARVRVLEEALEELLAKVQFYIAHEWPSDMGWIEIFLCCTLNDLDEGGTPDVR